MCNAITGNLNSCNSIFKISILFGSNSIFSPFLANSYALTPLMCLAEYNGGTWFIIPLNSSFKIFLTFLVEARWQLYHAEALKSEAHYLRPLLIVHISIVKFLIALFEF